MDIYEDEKMTISADEKEAILQEEKERAIEMVKTASFRGSTQDPYPSPFLNLSDTKIPSTSQEIFKWCKYFYMFDPLISGAINSLSAFPITEVYLEDINEKESMNESDSETLKVYKRVMFKTINIHKLLIEIGIDYHLYGNCFIFGEMYTNPTTNEKEWKHMVRLDPSKMTIDYNPATQEKVYKWAVPASIIKIVRNKKPKREYDKIPDIIKKAALDKKSVILNPNNIYHFSRATDSLGDNNVWGTPVVANVLKLLMYRNTLRQAQEAIAREHIVPMRVYYLQKTEDYSMEADWNKVASDFAAELMKSVKDPNYKVVSPVPVNMLSVGGQGRALLLTPEIQQVQEEILAGMNVPREFIFGGVGYSGSSISLKILENHFITYRVLLKDFMQNFIVKGMAKARKEWVDESDDDCLVTVRMTDLKMQDDVQQKQLVIQLNGAGKCTNEHMWKIMGLDPDKMRESLKSEAIAAIETESEVNIRRMELQIVEMDKQIELQKKQIEMNALLQLHQSEISQQFQNATGVNIDSDSVGQPQEEGVPQEGVPQEGVPQEGVPQEGVPQEGVPQEGVPQEGVPQKGVPQEGVPQEGAPQEGVPQKDDGDGISPEIKRIALQIIKLPKKYRDKPISTFPEETQVALREAISRLEMANDAKKQISIDMRPMPEQLPPRRNSLK